MGSWEWVFADTRPGAAMTLCTSWMECRTNFPSTALPSALLALTSSGVSKWGHDRRRSYARIVGPVAHRAIESNDFHKHGWLYVHRYIFMPNWTFKEIRNADTNIKHDMDLDYRWAVPYFGGTVRYTFEADEEAVTLQITNVQTALFSQYIGICWRRLALLCWVGPIQTPCSIDWCTTK